MTERVNLQTNAQVSTLIEIPASNWYFKRNRFLTPDVWPRRSNELLTNSGWPREAILLSSLTALFPRLLHPLSFSRSPLKNVSRLAQSQSRRLVCFYTTILQTPVRHILWLNGLKKCLIRYVLAYIVMDI